MSNFNATILKFSEKYQHSFSIVFIFGNMCHDSRGYNRHSNETVTLRKHVTKHSNIRKFMIMFPRKCENRSIKIARFNLILITKSTKFNYYN